jgi:hypothetical protein
VRGLQRRARGVMRRDGGGQRIRELIPPLGFNSGRDDR